MNRPDPHATRAHWDALACQYDWAKARNDAYFSALKRCFDAAVPSDLRRNILDVGCGTGQLLAFLRPERGLGIDISQRMIETARHQFAQRQELTFAVADAATGTLPPELFSQGPFDAVVSADMLEHVADWQTALATMVAACRAGGVVAVSTPNPRWTLPLWILERVRLKMPEGPHRFVPGRSIAQHLASLGCTVRQATTHQILPVHLAGLGPRISRISERLPVLNGLGVIQLIVAVKEE